MFKLDVPLDRKEAAYVERRRRLEEERKARIFDAKYRTIGVDKGALEQQVEDRRRSELREKERENAFMSDLLYSCKLSQVLEERETEDRRRTNKSINEFRAENQAAETRREWDLNDPDWLKKSSPPRREGSDLGPSSLQVFEGEDAECEGRRLWQQEQNREWLGQQMKGRGEERRRERRADELYHQKMAELDRRLGELDLSEGECRRRINRGTMEFNRELASQRDSERTEAARRADEDKRTHMLNIINSDMLTENPAVSQSVHGPHRVIPDRWKGMSGEQLGEIREVQRSQAEEANRLREEKRRWEESWQRQMEARDRAELLGERDRERRRREKNGKVRRENQRLAEEQRSRREYMEKCLYTNEPQYFLQFNTTSR